MCLDIAFYSGLELIEQYFSPLEMDPDIHFDSQLGEHVIGMSYRKYPVLLKEQDHYRLRLMEWGIIAEYMDTPEKIKAMRPKMLNARSEKILGDKRSYWHRIRNTRCLIPVTGIYEHREIKGWKNKVPYFVRLKGEKMYFLPGLYHYNEFTPSDPRTGEMQGMFTLITREANGVMEKIHNGGFNAFRMPLFLPGNLQHRWLEPGLGDKALTEILDYELGSEALEYWPVFSIRTNKPRPDGKRKMDPYAWPGLPPLGQDDPGTQKQALF
jgi:putative SOS response-associated peptidase YedK